MANEQNTERKVSKRRRHLSRAIESGDLQAQYDAYVKEILSDKEILARLLKEVTEEFKDCSIKEIISCIESPVISEIPVNPGLTGKWFAEHSTSGERIVGMNTDDTVGNEGEDTFDIRFSAVTPKEQHEVKIIVNAEAQRKYYPGYDLLSRGIFYGARNISAQKDVEFTGDDYDKICKVYSVWICMETPKAYADTITVYEMNPRDLHGHFSGKARYDLLTIVMIRLGDGESENELINLLETVLSEKIEASRKEKILELEFGIYPDEERGGHGNYVQYQLWYS